MTSFELIDPPPADSERALLLAFLDYQRAVLLRKVDGLSDADLRRIMTPTGLSLLGLVKHLGYVERSWFQMRLLGEQLPVPWNDADPDADFRIEPDETTEEVLSFYRAQVERSRLITAQFALDDRARGFKDEPSLRWILLHMIEEVARHDGHADIMREAIDGQVGD